MSAYKYHSICDEPHLPFFFSFPPSFFVYGFNFNREQPRDSSVLLLYSHLISLR